MSKFFIEMNLHDIESIILESGYNLSTLPLYITWDKFHQFSCITENDFAKINTRSKQSVTSHASSQYFVDKLFQYFAKSVNNRQSKLNAPKSEVKDIVVVRVLLWVLIISVDSDSSLRIIFGANYSLMELELNRSHARIAVVCVFLWYLIKS